MKRLSGTLLAIALVGQRCTAEIHKPVAVKFLDSLNQEQRI